MNSYYGCTRQLIQSYAHRVSYNHPNSPAMAGIIIAGLQIRQMRLILPKDKASKYKSGFKPRPDFKACALSTVPL